MAAESEIIISSGSSADDAPPSRYELLSMVRKHSKSLAEMTADEHDDLDAEMDSGFWHEMLDLYFIRGRALKRHEDDDLVYFVRSMRLHGYGFNDNMEDGAPFFVRRWASELRRVVGDNFKDVDWRRSFYLNLIVHTSFTVSVAICSVQALHRYQRDEDASVSSVYKVVKTVYASPSRVDFHLDFKKDVETLPAYPNICFAVDDFDDTFDAVVLSETDHCYCVVLNSHGGAAFPSEETANDSSSCRDPAIGMNSESGKEPKLTLFSGFVSYHMVREAYDSGKSRFGSLLSVGQISSKTDRLYMRGPGGRGEVEVAVSGIADQSLQSTDPSSPLQLSKRGLGIGLGTIVHKAASAASVLAKHAYAAASNSQTSDGELLPLKCCLRSICLPWETIAHDLLHKDGPPVNL